MRVAPDSDSTASLPARPNRARGTEPPAVMENEPCTAGFDSDSTEELARPKLVGRKEGAFGVDESARCVTMMLFARGQNATEVERIMDSNVAAVATRSDRS